MFDFLSRRVSELKARRERRAALAQVEAMEPRTLLSVNAGISVPDTGTAGNTFAISMSASWYDGTGSCQSCGSGGAITYWVVDWGDGGNQETILGNPSQATHTYAFGSAFSITATAYADDDTSRTVTGSTFIADQGSLNVTVYASDPNYVGLDLWASLSAILSSSTQTNIASWEISWGDGSNPQIIYGNTSSAAHIYDTAGEYTIEAKATTTGGVSGTGSATVEVKSRHLVSDKNALTVTKPESGTANSETATITARDSNDNQAPLPGVDVKIYDAAGNRVLAGNGIAVFKGVAGGVATVALEVASTATAGTYRVEVSAQGCDPVNITITIN